MRFFFAGYIYKVTLRLYCDYYIMDFIDSGSWQCTQEHHADASSIKFNLFL